MGLTAVHPHSAFRLPKERKQNNKRKGDEKQVWRKTYAQFVTLAWQSEEICNLFVKKEVLFSKKSAQKFGGNPKVRTFAAF